MRPALGDLTNRPQQRRPKQGKQAASAAPAAVVVARQPAASPLPDQPAGGPQETAGEAVLLRSFRKLSFDEGEGGIEARGGGSGSNDDCIGTLHPGGEGKEQLSGEEQQVAAQQHEQPLPELDGEDSTASTATASGAGSQLGSPLAAFATAKARLLRSSSDADGLISSTLQRLAQQHAPTDASEAASETASAAAAYVPAGPAPSSAPGASAAADNGSGNGSNDDDINDSGSSATVTAPAASPSSRGSAVVVHAPQRRTLQAGGSSSSSIGSSGAGPAPLAAGGALQKRNMVLKERLHTTLRLCQELHQQNQESQQVVARLQADNQQLSQSLTEARLDKQALQQVIRQLTQEAALLAQQAQQALLPAQQLPGGSSAAAEQSTAEAAPTEAAAPAVGGTAAPPAAPVAAAAAVAAVPAGPELSLVRDWSQAQAQHTLAGSLSSRGAAWRPGTLVHCFDCSSLGPGSDGGMAAVPVPYVQGSSDSAAAGDKRRRLAPGLLAHCLRPVVAAAVAEAAAMESMGGASGSGNGRVGRMSTPGRTPKRKHRQLSTSGSAGSRLILQSAASAAPLQALAQGAATQHTLHFSEGGTAAVPQLTLAVPAAVQAVEAPPAASAEQTGARGQATTAGASEAFTAGSAASAGAAAVAVEVLPQAEQYEFETFKMYDSMWYGAGGGTAAAALSRRNGTSASASRPGCRIM